MTTPTELRLEGALRAWEDVQLIKEIRLTHRAILQRDVSGDLLTRAGRWRRYRTTLMDNRIERLAPIDWIPLLPPRLERECGLTGSEKFDTFPLEFFEWTRKSRKVFVLPQAEQNLFSIATFPDMRWGDIMWPFDAFGIELAAPLSFEATPGTYLICTHLLVARVVLEDKTFISVRPLCDGINPVLKFGERSRLMSALEAKDWRSLFAQYNNLTDRLGAAWQIDGAYAFALRAEPEETDEMRIVLSDDDIDPSSQENQRLSILGRTLRNATPALRDALIRMARIVIGTCLHLESVCSRGGVRDEVRRSGKKYMGPLGVITDEVYVCRIIGRSTIDPDAVGSYGDRQARQGFIRPHWRRAHWRRPQNTPPTHPKTIRVPAKLINAEYVPLFGILPGSIARLLSSE